MVCAVPCVVRALLVCVSSFLLHTCHLSQEIFKVVPQDWLKFAFHAKECLSVTTQLPPDVQKYTYRVFTDMNELNRLTFTRTLYLRHCMSTFFAGPERIVDNDYMHVLTFIYHLTSTVVDFVEQSGATPATWAGNWSIVFANGFDESAKPTDVTSMTDLLNAKANEIAVAKEQAAHDLAELDAVAEKASADAKKPLSEIRSMWYDESDLPALTMRKLMIELEGKLLDLAVFDGQPGVISPDVHNNCIKADPYDPECKLFLCADPAITDIYNLTLTMIGQVLISLSTGTNPPAVTTVSSHFSL